VVAKFWLLPWIKMYLFIQLKNKFIKFELTSRIIRRPFKNSFKRQILKMANSSEGFLFLSNLKSSLCHSLQVKLLVKNKLNNTQKLTRIYFSNWSVRNFASSCGIKLYKSFPTSGALNPLVNRGPIQLKRMKIV